MKKLFCLLAVFMIGLGLALPNQSVSAKVTRIDVTLQFAGYQPIDDGHIWTTPGGIEHWRDVVVSVYYTANDPRIQGWCTMVMNRNIRQDGSAVGYGTWSTEPEDIADGWWAGNFTATMDSDGLMTVKMNGKGYGSLDGLHYKGDLESYSFGPIYGVITETPSYMP